MNTSSPPTPRDREVWRLFSRGKSPEIIAIRMGLKVSKVLLVIAEMPKVA
jgi:DNA-binding CsgD family transcriptional regulator